LLQDQGDDRRKGQDQDQRAFELAEQQSQCRQPWRFFDAVRANGSKLRFCLTRRQAARRRAEVRRQCVGIKRP
jgi:hypothetical protein